MRHEISRVSIVVLVMFLALFGSTTLIQAVHENDLNTDPRNARTIQDGWAVERGAIIAGDDPIVQSVPADGNYPFQREYVNGPLYAAVTGYHTIGQGDTGLELAMDAELTGRADSQFFSEVERILTGRDPQGAAVVTTIVPEAQVAAAEGLGDRVGAAVALDPATGDILAMYSSPTFDPNTLASLDSGAVTEQYNALLADPRGPLHNRAIAGDLFFPGSVFKLVVLAAALESGEYTLDTKLDNPVSVQLPGSSNLVYNSTRQACAGGGNKVTLREALRYSCNVPFAQLASDLGEEAIAAQAAKFGFGENLQVPMHVTPSTYPSNLDPAQLMLTGFGQYDVRVTPLQMAMIAAAIDNNGVLMQPNLVQRVVTDNLTVLSEPSPGRIREAVSPATAKALREAMIDGVENGYASDGDLGDATVTGGKTGTAENGEANEPYNLWYTAFAERDGKQVAVAVVVVPDAAEGEFTPGETAVPVAKSVMEAVLHA